MPAGCRSCCRRAQLPRGPVPVLRDFRQAVGAGSSRPRQYDLRGSHDERYFGLAARVVTVELGWVVEDRRQPTT